MIPALCPSHLTKLDDDDDEFITIWMCSIHIISQWSSFGISMEIYRDVTSPSKFMCFLHELHRKLQSPWSYIFFFALVLNSRFPCGNMEKYYFMMPLMRSQLKGIDSHVFIYIFPSQSQSQPAGEAQITVLNKTLQS